MRTRNQASRAPARSQKGIKDSAKTINADRLNSLEESLIVLPRKTGRPSSYSPTLCGEMVGLMAQGMSMNEAIVRLGHTTNVLSSWSEKHPQFAKALEEGRALQQAWWEAIGRVNIFNPSFNSTLFIYITANCFGWRRTDAQQTVNVNNSGTVNHRHVHLKVSLKGMSDEDLRVIEKARRLVASTATRNEP